MSRVAGIKSARLAMDFKKVDTNASSLQNQSLPLLSSTHVQRLLLRAARHRSRETSVDQEVTLPFERCAVLIGAFYRRALDRSHRSLCRGLKTAGISVLVLCHYFRYAESTIKRAIANGYKPPDNLQKDVLPADFDDVFRKVIHPSSAPSSEN